jgi:CheY-like chemotaxis protein
MFRILIAEDDELFRRKLAQRLACADGLEVVGTATNGATTLELCRHLQPDVVIVGMRLPPLGGLALIGALKELSPGTYLIGLSASDCPTTLSAAFAAGASGYLLQDKLDVPFGLSLLTAGQPRSVPVQPAPEQSEWPADGGSRATCATRQSSSRDRHRPCRAGRRRLRRHHGLRPGPS